MARIEKEENGTTNIFVTTPDGEKTIHGCCSQSGLSLSVAGIEAHTASGGIQSLVRVAMQTLCASAPKNVYPVLSTETPDTIRQLVKQALPEYKEPEHPTPFGVTTTCYGMV